MTGLVLVVRVSTRECPSVAVRIARSARQRLARMDLPQTPDGSLPLYTQRGGRTLWPPGFASSSSETLAWHSTCVPARRAREGVCARARHACVGVYVRVSERVCAPTWRGTPQAEGANADSAPHPIPRTLSFRPFRFPAAFCCCHAVVPNPTQRAPHSAQTSHECVRCPTHPSSAAPIPYRR